MAEKAREALVCGLISQALQEYEETKHDLWLRGILNTQQPLVIRIFEKLKKAGVLKDLRKLVKPPR